MFANLGKLLYLNVSSNNLTEIETGTFSSLTKLQTLDLSNNQLKTLNANILPAQSMRLKWFLIQGNQLRDLNGFTNAQYPNMKIFGIDSNRFSCVQ